MTTKNLTKRIADDRGYRMCIASVLWTLFSNVPAVAQVLDKPAAASSAASAAIDPGAPPKTRIPIAPSLAFGARLELEYTFQENFDLNEGRSDDTRIGEPQLSVALSYDPNPDFQAYVNAVWAKKFEREAGKNDNGPTRLNLAHAFVLLRNVTEGLSLQLGRQRFRDEREWLFDDQLDAARAFFRVSDVALEFSVSRKNYVDGDLLNDVRDERIDNYLASGVYAIDEKTLVRGYAFLRQDRTPQRQRPLFLGVHSSGEIIHDLDYWLELAIVRGRAGPNKIRGTGLDLGLTYEFDPPMKPSLTLAYAFGSGDADPADRTDHGFRQSRLQDNSDKFNGVVRLKYYGELFNPELSNLNVFTLGAGIRPVRRSSIDLVYHHYRQHKALNQIRNSEIAPRPRTLGPTGLDKELGSEVDLVFGYRAIKDLDLTLVLGYFKPGDAFQVNADDAFLTNFEIRYNF